MTLTNHQIMHMEGLEILERIATTKYSLLYRAYSEEKKCTLIVKMHKNEQPTSNIKNRYKREFDIRKQLADNPHVIQYYELKRFDSRFAILMEDFYGVPLCNVFPKVSDFYSYMCFECHFHKFNCAIYILNSFLIHKGLLLEY